MTTQAFSPDNLMTHMRVLCKEIGPRQSASPKEKQAAGYVKQALARLGVNNVVEQPFKSHTTLGWAIIPLGLIEALLALAGMFSDLAVASGALLLLCGAVMYGFTRVRPVPWERLVARHASQNIIATIPASQPSERRIFLVGHLDSNKQRFMMPPPNPAWMRRMVTLLTLLPVGLGLIILMPLGEGLSWLRVAAGAIFVLIDSVALLALLRDEMQPVVEGANDNASAVSVLLGVAEALQGQALRQSEVVLLFTGCEESGCAGMETYLQQYRPYRDNTYWIDIEMVGTGNLCYITKHGVSDLAQYAPAPQMVTLAAQAAGEHPELTVTGKEMLIVEEVSMLRFYDYNAICVAGYDAQGYLPNWHRVSDTLEAIEPETLSRAAQYTWALMNTIDNHDPEPIQHSPK